MELRRFSRGEFLWTGAAVAAWAKPAQKPAVSVVRIKNDKIGMAVEEAIHLLGGMKRITKGKHSAMLKPNLVSTQANATTNREVIRTLAQLMQKAGMEVSIGEGSAAAPKFNVVGMEAFRTRKR